MIGSAQQKHGTVYVYDEKGHTLFTKSGTLIGFTSTTVTIQSTSGSTLYTYDEKGHTLYTK
jgi:hypothetical protein